LSRAHFARPCIHAHASCYLYSAASCAAYITRVSAAADRPERCSGSAHAKYSVSHHMVIKQFLLFGLAAEYRSRRWMWSTVTVVRRPSEVMTLTGELSWQRLRPSAAAEIWFVFPKNLNGSRDLITPLSGMVCRQLAIDLLPSTYLPNLKSLSPFTTEIWKAIQNGVFLGS